MASIVECSVHPVVLFTIVDSFERRQDQHARVIGTLLGTNVLGAVEITNCFCVPHNESEDEVAVDIEFAKNMFDLHKKVNPAESIVGWYATGHGITEHSVLIHEYYSRECNNPVHLTINTSLSNQEMAMKAWLGNTMGVPGATQGVVFTPVSFKLVSHEPERVALDTLIQGKSPTTKTVDIFSDLNHVGRACYKLKEMLSAVISYVDNVLSGKTPADNQVGRFLMDLVSNVPQLDTEQFEQMINDNMKDLLMVVYLTTLINTQLTLNEKLVHIRQSSSKEF
ncbi:eukaryotic translation initiation factor 3 subunit F-like [Antedon mediterranea]|uniref:eukaryotic translation initiation factor 3 subunit F-like n=1 Tax=Antedon mediterranea TaxID=105859 RepID=UPI003AF9A479